MARVGGRQKGSLNKVTAKFKEAVQIVYEDIGGHAAFAQWAKENPGDFYRISSKLIPVMRTLPRKHLPGAECMFCNQLVSSSIAHPRGVHPWQQNDRNGTRTIWTAVQQPHVKAGAIRAVGQLAILALQRMRGQVVKFRARCRLAACGSC